MNGGVKNRTPDSQDRKLNIVFLDFLDDFSNVISIHLARAIGDKENSSDIFQFLAKRDYHLNRNN